MVNNRVGITALGRSTPREMNPRRLIEPGGPDPPPDDRCRRSHDKARSDIRRAAAVPCPTPNPQPMIQCYTRSPPRALFSMTRIRPNKAAVRANRNLHWSGSISHARLCLCSLSGTRGRKLKTDESIVSHFAKLRQYLAIHCQPNFLIPIILKTKSATLL